MIATTKSFIDDNTVLEKASFEDKLRLKVNCLYICKCSTKQLYEMVTESLKLVTKHNVFEER